MTRTTTGSKTGVDPKYLVVNDPITANKRPIERPPKDMRKKKRTPSIISIGWIFGDSENSTKSLYSTL